MNTLHKTNNRTIDNFKSINLDREAIIELRQLRAFVAVAEERHFGRAAERLHTAQPALSQTIRRMEETLGAPLFHRTTRQVELSPAGTVLLPRAVQILAATDAATLDAQRAARGEFGRLSIGFAGSTTYSILPPLATALRTQLPGVALDLQGDMLTPAQVDGLISHRLDLAVLRPPVLRPELAYEVVRREPLVAVLPHGHRLARMDVIDLGGLAEDPFVTYPSHLRSVLYDAVRDACAAHGFHPRSALEVAETATLVSFVAAGMGVSLVPMSVARMTVAGAVYRPLADESHEVELAVAWRPDGDPTVERALDVVREAVPAV